MSWLGRQAVVAGAALAMTLGAAACSHSPGEESSGRRARSTVASTSPTTATSVIPEHAALLDAWHRYVNASLEWENPPNPGDPRIPGLVAKGSLGSYRQGLAVERAKRTAQRPGPAGPPNHHTRVVDMSAARATLHDCFVDDAVAYNFETGEVIDKGVSTRSLRVALILENGTWKVTTIESIDARPGRQSCD